MDRLDLEILFGELFEKCKNEEQVIRLEDELYEIIDLCKEEYLDMLEEENG